MVLFHSMCTWMIDEFGDEKLRTKYVPRLCTMEVHGYIMYIYKLYFDKTFRKCGLYLKFNFVISMWTGTGLRNVNIIPLCHDNSIPCLVSAGHNMIISGHDPALCATSLSPSPLPPSLPPSLPPPPPPSLSPSLPPSLSSSPPTV